MLLPPVKTSREQISMLSIIHQNVMYPFMENTVACIEKSLKKKYNFKKSLSCLYFDIFIMFKAIKKLLYPTLYNNDMHKYFSYVF